MVSCAMKSVCRPTSEMTFIVLGEATSTMKSVRGPTSEITFIVLGGATSACQCAGTTEVTSGKAEEVRLDTQ